MKSAGVRRVLPAAVLLAVLAPALAACQGGGQPEVTPKQALAGAKAELDKTPGVHIVLAAKKLPQNVSGLLSADGVGTHAPAFKGSIKVAAGGITADAKVIATQGKVYAVLPFTTKYAEIRPADYGAPDPAELMSPDGGLSSLLTEARDVTAGKQQRSGDQVLSTYSGTVPGTVVASIIPSADAGQDFDVTFQVSSKDERLHEAVLTGPFYPRGGDVTYTVTFDDYGISPTITAP
jgi:lipoprotein LprG